MSLNLPLISAMKAHAPVRVGHDRSRARAGYVVLGPVVAAGAASVFAAGLALPPPEQATDNEERDNAAGDAPGNGADRRR